MATITETVTMETYTCGVCGITFAAPQSFWAERRKDHEKEWYCPNGHPRVFVGKTEAQELQEELDRERHARQLAESDLQYANKRAAKIEKREAQLKKRIHNGVCPCCKRSFQNLQRHMANQHPAFSAEK